MYAVVLAHEQHLLQKLQLGGLVHFRPIHLSFVLASARVVYRSNGVNGYRISLIRPSHSIDVSHDLFPLNTEEPPAVEEELGLCVQTHHPCCVYACSVLEVAACNNTSK